MDREDKPERDVHCTNCAAALSDFERCQLFNKCAFCSKKIRTIFKRTYMLYAMRQIEIFDLKLKLKERYGDDATYQFFGVLGNLGVTSENDLTPKLQIKAVKEIKKQLKERG